MKKVTLTNSFHNTSAVVCVHPSVANLDQREIYRWLQSEAYNGKGLNSNQAEKQKLKRIWQKLCGSNDCKCGVVR